MTAKPSVAIVIPCYQYARFLAGAIESALDQRVPAAEILVVDDGSTDRPETVVVRYASVRLISQPNRGLAAARNAGLHAVDSDKVIFLDADDRLLPITIEAGLAAFEQRPEAAFVYGPYREVRRLRQPKRFREASGREDLIRSNMIGMIGTVMFDRDKLLKVGGFDESLAMCEDWDVYLRLAREHPFAVHREIVAKYVRHRKNMSNDTDRLLHWVEIVREREKQRGLSGQERVAWEEGADFFARAYAKPMQRALRAVRTAVRPWRERPR